MIGITGTLRVTAQHLSSELLFSIGLTLASVLYM